MIKEDGYYNKDERKRETWNTVSVIFGILAYILLLIKSVFWTILFATFAFKTDLPNCVSAPGLQEPINLMEQMSAEPLIE